jgi:hypothetical protein
MNQKTHLSEKEFDQFCRELVNAAQAREEEIHAAANAPFLYQRLRAQIAAEQKPIAAVVPPRSSALSVVAALGVLNRLGQGGRWAFVAAALALVVWFGWQGPRPVPQVAQQPAPSASPQQVAQATTETAPALPVEKPLPTTRKTTVAKTTANKSLRIVERVAEEIATEDAEIATDFMPLTYTTQRDEQNAQIVRMEMPRSVLATMGVPVANVTGDRIKADVMLRDDGVALAIRFIQEQ